LFVQRNRSFFGQQGRKRMFDIRMLIGTQAASVAQGLRNHLSGQKQSNPPFGSPRPVVSWSANGGRPEATWEQISAATMVLQQQMQELRGEVKAGAGTLNDGRSANGAQRRIARAQPTASPESELHTPQQPPAAAPAQRGRSGPLPGTAQSGPLGGARHIAASVPPASAPAASASSTLPQKSGPLVSPAPSPVSPIPPTPVARKSEPLAPLAVSAPAGRKSEPLDSQTTSELPRARAAEAEKARTQAPAVAGMASTAAAQARSVSSAAPIQAPSVASGQREAGVMSVGEDDIAIFEQMRHQLVVWLRVEAITAGLEIAGQSPSQLLELLRQQGRLDDTRLQVVSTLLNLANQVIKTGLVSLIDYKQALMFHLMHTRR